MTHPAGLAHTLDLRVEPEIGIAALERSLAKRGYLPVEAGAQPETSLLLI